MIFLNISCMGDDPTKSVVNPIGETWEVKNLFISDSSIFPTATGVDPMITVMSFAYMIAKTISDKDSDIKTKVSSNFLNYIYLFCRKVSE